MTRSLAALLLIPQFASAAPVPKATAPKLEDLFGEIADKKTACQFEQDPAGVLTVTVPTKHPPLEPGADSTVRPMLAKKVEGDFVLTVRVSVGLPRKADATGNGRSPSVLAGVSVVSADDPTLGITSGERRAYQDAWTGAKLLSFRGPKQNNATEDDLPTPADKPTWWRVTRRGRELSVETSADGATWERFANVGVNSFGDTTLVGPVAFGNIDQEFSATFDKYEIKPLPKDEKK